MTPEEEAEARAFAGSDEPAAMRRENMLAAILRHDGRQRTARLLAEIDRLRALPVIATCSCPKCGTVLQIDRPASPENDRGGGPQVR